MLAYAQSYDWSMGYQGNTLDKPIHIRVCILKVRCRLCRPRCVGTCECPRSVGFRRDELTRGQPEDTDKRQTCAAVAADFADYSELRRIAGDERGSSERACRHRCAVHSRRPCKLHGTISIPCMLVYNR